jgi:tRNA 5-methylaminomethyl-2-thiouridine biosynthesis bifunctional protein
MTAVAGEPPLPAHLPPHWARRDDFVILDASFSPARFLHTWAKWRADADRCRRLFYIAPAVAQAVAGAFNDATGVDASLAQRLAQAWPVLTPGLHTLVFNEGPASEVTLLLGVGDVAGFMPQLVAWVDAFWLDGLPPAPLAANGDEGWLSRLPRWAAPGATAIAASQASNVLSGLAQSGFHPIDEDAPEAGPDTVGWRFSPRHTPPPLAGGLWPTRAQADHKHALIIGAGLAGCAATWALARQGWRVTLIDAHAEAAQGASGNPGGLFHSILHGEDGLHARAHRAAALRTSTVVAPWLVEGRFAGACQGLLRLDASLQASEAEALRQRLGLPRTHVQWLDLAAARAATGIPVPQGGWLFHQGGWVDPAGYAQALLAEARRHAEVVFQPGILVSRLQRQAQGDQTIWQALDDQGQVIAAAPVVVLAGAEGSARLIQSLPGAVALPLSAVRGQISSLPMREETMAPHMPVAGAGYVLPAHAGRLLFGATSHAGDLDDRVREADHRHNLNQAAQLGSLPEGMSAELPPGIQGRVGWRAVTPDRLPYVGPLPLEPRQHTAAGKRPPRTDQPRFVPRMRDVHGGIHVITGFGSRGITWAALAGELLASWVTGSPSPVEAPLRDALDPARIVARAKARENSG